MVHPFTQSLLWLEEVRGGEESSQGYFPSSIHLFHADTSAQAPPLLSLFGVPYPKDLSLDSTFPPLDERRRRRWVLVLAGSVCVKSMTGS